jgi:hypothetical protein
VQKESPGILRTLDDFWFGHGSPTSLGIFRIFIGFLTLVNFLMISVDWANWFSEHGFVPNWIERIWQGGGRVQLWADTDLYLPRLNLLSGVVDDRVSLAFYILTLVLAFLTMIGLWTRVSSIALAICVVSLHHRNEAILHGGDTVIRLMCLYLALSPCGRACSVDRLRRIWKGVESSAPVRVSLWSQRLIMYNMALIYFTTTWLKRTGDLWMNGTATYYPAHLGEFGRFPYPSFVNSPAVVMVTTYGTLVLEFLLSTLVFYRPARKYVLAGGLLMHAWIEYSMNVPLFSYLMVSCYITFYDGEEVSAWFRKQGEKLSRWAVHIEMPSGQQLDPRGHSFFGAVDPLGLVHYERSEAPALTAASLRKSWSRSLGALPWGWWPGLWKRLLTAALEPVPIEVESPRKGKRANP